MWKDLLPGKMDGSVEMVGLDNWTDWMDEDWMNGFFIQSRSNPEKKLKLNQKVHLFFSFFDK